MVNLEHKLTVDDLIVEYMMYKVNNGYEPKFTTSEFYDFLKYFETKMKVEDTLYNGEELFKRFFERKKESDWSYRKNFNSDEIVSVPHMDMEYSEKDNDYIISANYHFSEFDRSVINTYFMDNGMGQYKDYKGTTWKIRNIISSYVSTKQKRVIDESTEVSEKESSVGKFIAAEIITDIWQCYIDDLIKHRQWPDQCTDINKYLFEQDLAEIIGLKSIKKELLELYSVLSKRIAILYHNDNNLKVGYHKGGYLGKENYKLLIQGYEDLISIAYGQYKKTLGFDLSQSISIDSYSKDDIYDFDESKFSDTVRIIENSNSKKLIKNVAV